jgi:hypothetical protein
MFARQNLPGGGRMTILGILSADICLCLLNVRILVLRHMLVKIRNNA